MVNTTAIKVKMVELGMKQRDLIRILNEKYGMDVDASYVSMCVNGVSSAPKAQKVRELIRKELNIQ